MLTNTMTPQETHSCCAQSGVRPTRLPMGGLSFMTALPPCPILSSWLCTPFLCLYHPSAPLSFFHVIFYLCPGFPGPLHLSPLHTSFKTDSQLLLCLPQGLLQPFTSSSLVSTPCFHTFFSFSVTSCLFSGILWHFCAT